MIVNLIAEITPGTIASIHGNNLVDLLVLKSYLSSTLVLAQDYAIFTNFQKAWNNFVSTGQIGAFFIGMFIGWFIKGIMP